ncbi:unnamed protein product [Schistosoma haematobium]|nr:unnamed protein product [Schistosoma haematobium]
MSLQKTDEEIRQSLHSLQGKTNLTSLKSVVNYKFQEEIVEIKDSSFYNLLVNGLNLISLTSSERTLKVHFLKWSNTSRYYNQEKKSQRTNTKTSTLYMKYLGNKVLVHHRYSQKRPRNYKPYFA